MYASSLVILRIGVCRNNFTGVGYVYPIHAERNLAAMAPEVLDGNALIVLFFVHRDRNHPPLIPVSDVPCTWPADADIATKRKIFGVFINHLAGSWRSRGEV